jgi:peptidoglycan/LPS O-acetylase OafA/YrhL
MREDKAGLATQGTKLASLTSLRFFAAAMIVAYHSLGVVWWPSDAVAPFMLNQGVSFFFVLSGFVLHLNYRGAIANRELGFGDFIVRRWFRLWPAHVAALLFVVALAPAISFSNIIESFSAFEIFQFVFMLHSLNPEIGVYWAINGPAWSISTEFVFYLALPMISALTLRYRGAALAGVCAWVVAYLVAVASVPLDENQLTGLVYISPLARILEFALGVYVCEVWVAAKERGSAPQTGVAAELGALVGVALVMYFSEAASTLVGGVLGRTFERYVEVAFAAPAFAALIFVFASNAGPISKLLSRRPFVLLGEISFALYLVHVTMLHYVGNTGWVRALPLPGQVAVYAAATLVVAWLGFRTIETYGIQLGKRISARLR